jgi:predicted CoA-substrate-specific enzyme activase
MNSKTIYVGIDIGSVSANTVVLDEDRNVLEEKYTRTQGEPLKTALTVLEDIVSRYGESAIKMISATGTGGKLIAPYLGAVFTNEVIAQAKGTEHFYPEAKTVIEMGGQDAKLILLDTDAEGKVRIGDFEMNSVCAAGTGSFLDQQATRMNLTIEEFGELALKCKNPPRIAGRCSVFAKSDMIHLQQIATPDYDIVAGLCHAVARNFTATIGKGKVLATPVVFQGGVAANAGVRAAFKDILKLEDKDYIIPKHFAAMGAVGAVLNALEKEKGIGEFKGLDTFREYLKEGLSQHGALDALITPVGHPSQRDSSAGYPLDVDNKVDVYMGLDIGSTSTNVVLIDKDKKVVSKCYIPTSGRPLEAVRNGLSIVADECEDSVNVIGVGSTGSGRYLIGDFVGSDVVRNEITAQAKAAAAIDETVDTIFEIGGQDSKFIGLKDGVVVDFEMNKVCAAGTGSFLEEQAERLGISIKGDFSDLALDCEAPPPMGDRCTVFIETDMVHFQQKGVDKGGLVSGLAYSIVHNYLNRVVGDRRIGDNIFFQGGTAANLAVVAAFEKVTGKKITVPENHDVTGSIGVAILAMEEMEEGQKTCFKGFDLSKKKYELSSFECRDCSNICEVRKVVIEGEDPLYYGGRCEKYDVQAASKKESTIPNLYKERDRFLFSAYKGKAPVGAPVIGIPRILTMFEQYPFWKAFLTEMGFRVKFSPPTTKAIIKEGMDSVLAETCFPIKVAHGHVSALIDSGVERIFMPSIVNMPKAKPTHVNTVLCPYVQSFPYMCEPAFDFGDIEVLTPAVHFNQSRELLLKEFKAFGKTLGVTDGSKVEAALDIAFEAQATFKRNMLERGKKALDELGADDIALVIVGRAYNTADPAINLDLPAKLRDMGTLAIPFDMLPVDEAIDDVMAKEMYWKSGQRILSTARIIKDDPRLFSVYITNFGCGPDSYISHFYAEESGGKPFLQLEIDEHSADAGAITRCEAYMDSLRNVRKRGIKLDKTPEKYELLDRTKVKKKLLIPYMADGAHALAAAFQASGIDASVIPMPNDETLQIGRRYTSGRECYPSILTTGDMVKIVQSPDFDREGTAFFMPSGSGPCRFGQYNRYHRKVLDELGFTDVPVYAPNQDDGFYKELGVVEGDFPKLAWWGILATDLMEKMLWQTRPYEVEAGATDKVYWKCIEELCNDIRNQKFPERALNFAREAFKSIEVKDQGTRPVIGIVGEIYVRSSAYSNGGFVKELEAMGAEVRVPPVSEWIYYTNFVSKRKSWDRRQYGDFFRTIFNNFFQTRYERKMENIISKDLRFGHELSTKNLVDLASPYIADTFEGEAVLCVGKVIDYVADEADGIINVMPFACMPGTIVHAVLKRVRADHDNIPYLNMVFEGIEDTNAKTRMEAFLHQARDFQLRREAKKANSGAASSGPGAAPASKVSNE